jgi:hypothetical protein
VVAPQGGSVRDFVNGCLILIKIKENET